MIVFFDIDGTLADITHRLHYINKPTTGTKPDWDSFHKACSADAPIQEMLNLCKMFPSQHIYFLTGRPETVRKQTHYWLNAQLGHNRPHDSNHLIMRPAGDYRTDYVVKQEMLDNLNVRPDIVFDDRQQVVDMWRRNGIRCCQVAKGDF